jgi:annexin A7/11
MKGLGTRDKSLMDVLAYSTNDEIRKIKYEYECFYGKPGEVNKLEVDIKGDTTGSFERTLCSLLRAERDETFALNQDRVTQDAKLIYEKGESRIGTDDSYFIEFFTKRSPWHVHAVNEEYKKLHGHDLLTTIKKECSGDFKDLLCALVTPKAIWYAERLDYAMKGIGTHDNLLIYLLTSTTEIERMAIAKKYEEMYKRSLKATIVADTSGDYQKVLVSLVSFGADVDAHLKGSPSAKKS